MNILSQLRNPAAVLALAIAAPAMFLVGSGFQLPRSDAPMILMDRSVLLGSSGEGIVDELQAVRTTLASARRAMTSRDFSLASQMAAEASVDARVAERNAQSTDARKSAQETQNAARMLRAEIALRAQSQAVASN